MDPTLGTERSPAVGGLVAFPGHRAHRQQRGEAARPRHSARTQYAAYILHVPVVLGVQALLLPVALQPLVKFAIATAVSSALSFGIGYALKRIPGVKQVL